VGLYDHHGVFVAHSIYEGAAKACTEAMARGLVLDTSAVGALKDHVVDASNGYRAEVGDVDAMASSILRACSQQEQSIQIGREAADFMRNKGWRACAESSVAFYDQLLTMGRT
jgi:glycosyltransferase involved in cell wall biosynthesis